MTYKENVGSLWLKKYEKLEKKYTKESEMWYKIAHHLYRCLGPANSDILHMLDEEHVDLFWSEDE